MAAFEWAQVIAFDSESRLPLGVDDFLGADPSKLRLGVQPYVTLLNLHYPLDEFSLASTAGLHDPRRAIPQMRIDTSGRRCARFPKPHEIFLVVHRQNNSIYYKRLEMPAFELLRRLREGRSLAKAVEYASSAQRGKAIDAGSLQQWFQQWAAMGWFCL